MSFRVIIGKNAEKGIRNLPPAHLNRFAELVEALKINPVPVESFDVKKMRGSDRAYRVRLGSYRVLYTVHWDEDTVVILKVEPRERAYR
ncbi:type II toxin-antitoxin system RelE family toxin [Thermococcus thioreducens]|uniref:Addiction module toxin RelE n=1 Tax=Thermococcus thioreducens TaxID=277988 RepID=A0A0Q2QS76_9EURY|nr:type II toxin-antitoxin system RelE/ParE family toxin [Thermococcus thioreducens]ASJ13158.1 addiction module toxin RelE [Thermococcus thioreducens]KQH82877.1 addiction module toxin RelE [Thermococcus thioreducens]SEW20265.1 mRNA interferase RelE/StbE [Thermococcus thioreducens]